MYGGDVRVTVVGAGGYLGSEIAHKAHSKGFTVSETSRTPRDQQIEFDYKNPTSWPNVLSKEPDTIIWCVLDQSEPTASDPFAKFVSNIDRSKMVYVSSDVVTCQRLQNMDSRLGSYARRKAFEQQVVLERGGSAVFKIGPIYGENAAGSTDSRTESLANAKGTQEYWEDVYKTFVPVRRLAHTLLNNLGVTGEFFIGPPVRESYYDFYKARATQLALDTTIIASPATDRELQQMGVCRDTSYADNSSRLWAGDLLDD